MSSLPTTTEIAKGTHSPKQLQDWLPQAEHDVHDKGNWKYKNDPDLEAKVMPLLKDLGL
jgi:hypothetical protein